MKLNVRLLIFAFIIVLFVSVASSVIFYSLTSKLLTDQQSQDILNSTNDFVFAFQNSMEKIDEDFRRIYSPSHKIADLKLDSTDIDFIFTLVNDSLINKNEFKIKESSYINIRAATISKFFADNPNAILKFQQNKNGQVVYYGKVINANYLNELSQKIRAEVALVINESPAELSHDNKTQKYLLSIIEATRDLKYKNNYDIFTKELENTDFTASFYKPKQLLTPGASINFIVFKPYEAGIELRSTLRNIMVLVVAAGSALTFIFLLLFTAKVRRQVSLLTQAVALTGKGDFDNRVDVISKDEFGQLGLAFNRMLDEISRNKKTEKDYLEFITLINQNPSLKEISDAALSKIIKSTGLTFGALYILEDANLSFASSYGISKGLFDSSKGLDFYNNVIESKEHLEFNFKENFPEIKTGITSIKIKYLLIYPIVYNKKVIAILELASDTEPPVDIKKYLANIHEQLAIGLINAKSLKQLEELVGKLKKLNEEYQKQNKQISEQNEELKALHRQLKEKADELEFQRKNAVELTKVKSQFLASMSHELKTPLISVLGLTELMLKDSLVNVKSKERLNIVLRNAKRLLTLINNILDFSRIETGKIELKKETFLLSDLIEEVKINVENLALEKNLNFEILAPSEYDLMINTDKFKLEQILINLLTNAIKFTEKGFVQLRIDLTETDSIDFAVEDSGIGISEEDKKIIFSEFKQADSGISRKYGGAGLGLAICKKYVELLGSQLNVASRINSGSTFQFRLDNVLLDKIAKTEEKFLEPEIQPPKSDLNQKEVVIVNHNKDTSKLISDYLTSYSYKTYTFSSINDGIISSAKLEPHTIILEPGTVSENCWNSIISLKKNPLTEKTNIIVISILDKEKIGWALNVTDYLVPPVDSARLKKIIDSIEKSSAQKILEIWSLIDNDNEAVLLQDSLSDKYKLVNFESKDKFLEKIVNCTADLFLADLFYKSNTVFDVILKLNQVPALKEIPILLKLPENIDQNTVKFLNDDFNKTIYKAKDHPLDILKIIRDKVGIKEEDVEEKVMAAFTTTIKNQSKFVKTSEEVKPKILIVDDDRDTLFTIGEILKELNYDIVIAHDGLECLLILNQTNPDLILLDIMMPQMDGFETIKRIRAEYKNKNIPVIALTAYAMLENKNVIEKNGFNDLITKPIDTGALAQKVKSYININIREI